MKKLALKNFLLVLLLFIEAGFAQAQDNSKSAKDLYLSYFGNDSTNINMIYEPCDWFDYYELITGVIYNRDTIRINGNLYYYRAPQSLDLVMTPAPHYLFPRQDTLFLREERETGRLYRYYRNYFEMGETEKLICDMTLDVGDEFLSLDPPINSCLAEEPIIVNQVSYNNGVKTIEFFGGKTFKEGVFPPEFPIWQEPVEYGIPATFENLLCVHKDGVKVYGFNNNCFPNLWDIEEITEKQVSVYPNMVKGNDIITIESSSHIKNVTITNMFGKTIEISKNIIDDNKWQIIVYNKCGQGIYFVLVVTDNGMSYEKIILLD